MKELFTCSGCGKEVLKYRSQLTRTDVIFCTLSCRNKNYKKVFPEWHHPGYKGPIERICKQCNSKYLVPRVQSNSNRIFCSRKCRTESQKGKAPFAMTSEIKDILSIKQTQHCKQFGNQFVTGKSKGKHSAKTISQLSHSNSGKEPHWKGRTFLYDGPMGKKLLRSSYELFYAHWLDSQNMGWKYESSFKLSNGKMFSPDFQLNNGVIIEIKGYWSDIGKTKWRMFCTEYPQIKKVVLMKDDLISLGMKER